MSRLPPRPPGIHEADPAHPPDIQFILTIPLIILDVVEVDHDEKRGLGEEFILVVLGDDPAGCVCLP